MKKLIVGILAAFLMLGGLVAVSETTASAAKCPYTDCIKTNTNTGGSTKTTTKKKAPKVVVKISAQGNAKPEGKVTITFNPKGPGKSITVSAKYQGGKLVISGPKLDPGKYSVTVDFNAKAPFKDSSDGYTLKVK